MNDVTVMVKGRDLLRGTSPLGVFQADAIIAAIEAEAAAAVLSRVREQVEGLPTCVGRQCHVGTKVTLSEVLAILTAEERTVTTDQVPPSGDRPLTHDGHACDGNDVRNTLCGRWIGSETWEVEYGKVTCPECIARWAAGEGRERP